MTEIVNNTINDAVRSGVFPSAQILVAKKGDVILNGAYGNAALSTIFDIASLTKPISTTTLLIRLVAEDKLRLDDLLIHYVPECQCENKKAITIRHLLSHSSGLPAWQPYYQIIPTDDVGTLSGKLQIIDSSCREPLVYQPGKKSIYSDIGFILLGEIIERLTKQPLNKLFDEYIARPLGLNNTFFVVGRQSSVVSKTPITDDRRPTTSFAPTEHCPWRGKVIRGEVHDQNCYAMGGVAGHAGLFSTATEISKFITAFVESYKEPGKWLSQETVERFLPFRHGLAECNSTWLLGWDRPEHINSQAGSHYSNKSIGHLGYTGCSMWIDLEKDFWIVLLTNRIHPTTTNEKIKSFRPMLYNMIYEEMIS